MSYHMILGISGDMIIKNTNLKLKDLPTLLKSYILYENQNGTTGNINLNDNCSNYDFIDVFGVIKPDNFRCFGRLYDPNGKTLTLTHFMHTDVAYYRATTISFNHNQVTQSYNKLWYLDTVADNGIYITKIVGYKLLK